MLIHILKLKLWIIVNSISIDKAAIKGQSELMDEDKNRILLDVEFLQEDTFNYSTKLRGGEIQHRIYSGSYKLIIEINSGEKQVNILH